MNNSFLILFVLIFSCKSIPVDKDNTSKSEINTKIDHFEILEPTDLKENQLKLAKEFGNRLLGMCNDFKFKKFSSSEATPKVINNIDLEKMTKTCQKIFFRNGKFIDLELLEIKKDNLNGDLVFKFNIVYEKYFFKRELRLVLNSENKLSEISTKQISKIIK